MKRNIILVAALAVLALWGLAVATDWGLAAYEVTVVDEFGNTSGSTLAVTVYAAGTSSAATVYSDSNKTAIGTTLDAVKSGVVRFWGAAPSYDVQMSDGTTIVRAMAVKPTTGTALFPTSRWVQVPATLDLVGTSLASGDYGLSSVVTQTAAKSDGIAGYFEAHIAGTSTGPQYGVGCWLNVNSSAVTNNEIVALDVGIYEAGANLSGGTAFPLKLAYYADLTNPPSLTGMMWFNCDQAGDLPDCWFNAANPEAVAYTASTATAGTKVGAIKVRIHGSTADPGYILVYNDYK